MSETKPSNGTKEAKRILSEEDSLRCENLDLKSQVLRLSRRISDLEADLQVFQEAQQKQDRLAFLKKIGVEKEGRIAFIKQPDGRYEVSSEGDAEKK